MNCEINLDSTLTSDAEIIGSKRTRNSLSHVARIPSEILGYIFHLTVLPVVGDCRFAGIGEGAYNFLFVCRHWFQVANCTPELWCSWGNNLEDWKRFYLRSGTFALDLVLDGWTCRGGTFDDTLRDALRDRAARGVVRKVHLRGDNVRLLTDVVSSLTPEGEGIRHSSIESIVLGNVCAPDFFARHSFPKLRYLTLLEYPEVSSWDYLISHTMGLINLSLNLNDAFPPSAIPTTSQILSLSASNPNIEVLKLHLPIVNDDGRDGSRFRVSLRHLKRLHLAAKLCPAFSILHRLELPHRIDHVNLSFYDCTLEEIKESIGPYIRDYLRRDPRFEDRLGIYLSATGGSISLCASVVGVGYHGPNRLPREGPPYAKFTATASESFPCDARERVCIDILALLPQESIIYFETNLMVTEEMVLAMPNLEAFYLLDAVVSECFPLPKPDGPNAHKKLLPSLRWLYFRWIEVKNNDWDPLVRYLAHQTSGDQTISLCMADPWVHICSSVVEQIEELVEEFIYNPNCDCPFGECPNGM